MYIEYEYYKTLYGDKALAEADFNRLSWDAEIEIDKATSGIDGIKKLRVAFPTNEYDAECVKRCVCDLIDFFGRLEKAQNTVLNNGGIVVSKTAGNESVTYANVDTDITKSLKSEKSKEIVICERILKYLRGVKDANGVNLLYLSDYPFKIEVKNHDEV